MAPAEEYVSTFAPTLQRAQLAWRCAAVMHDNPFISYEAALPNVRFLAHLGASEWTSMHVDPALMATLPSASKLVVLILVCEESQILAALHMNLVWMLVGLSSVPGGPSSFDEQKRPLGQMACACLCWSNSM